MESSDEKGSQTGIIESQKYGESRPLDEASSISSVTVGLTFTHALLIPMIN